MARTSQKVLRADPYLPGAPPGSPDCRARVMWGIQGRVARDSWHPETLFSYEVCVPAQGNMGFGVH